MTTFNTQTSAHDRLAAIEAKHREAVERKRQKEMEEQRIESDVLNAQVELQQARIDAAKEDYQQAKARAHESAQQTVALAEKLIADLLELAPEIGEKLAGRCNDLHGAYQQYKTDVDAQIAASHAVAANIQYQNDPVRGTKEDTHAATEFIFSLNDDMQPGLDTSQALRVAIGKCGNDGKLKAVMRGIAAAYTGEILEPTDIETELNRSKAVVSQLARQSRKPHAPKISLPFDPLQT